MLFNFTCRTISTHARPCIKLQLFCNGLLSSSLFSTSTSDSHSFTATYLINSCGISPESAILASKRLDLSKSLNTADSVLALFHNRGFTKSQVSKVISRYPRILLCDPENTLSPNLQILSSIGLTKPDLVAIVTAQPVIVSQRKFQDTALPCVNYLRSVLGSDVKVVAAMKRFPLALTYDLQVYAAKNIQMLLELGVPKLRIKAMLAQQPRTFFTSADRFRKVVLNVKEMGFDPSKVRFLWAIHALRAMSKSTWDKKVELYEKWGFSKDDILMAFEKYPGCMMASMDKISRTLDFLVNTMGWEVSYIVQWPIVICFSSENRVIPRCLVYQYLAEKGLTEEKDSFGFTKWLMYSEPKFLKWLLKRYEEEAPELLKVYHKYMDEAQVSTPSTLRKRDVI